MNLLRAFLFLLISAVLLPLFGATAVRRSDDFLIKKWTTDDGLPQNTITSIVQTTDGYIWLGTFGGLARFDGIRFTTFDATNTRGFLSNRVLSLHENPKGGLWVGTDTGEIYLIRDNRLTEFYSPIGAGRKAVWGIEEDVFGCIYISSAAGIEAYDLDEFGWALSGSGRILTQAEGYKLYRDSNSRVWAQVGGQIALLDQFGLRSMSELGFRLPHGVFDLTFDTDGLLFVTGWTTLGEVSSTSYREIMPLNWEIHRAGSAIDVADGRVWYQQANELYEINGNDITVHDLGDYVKQGSRAIFEGREGNIWLATQADGLIRLSRKKVGSVASLAGSIQLGVFSVVQDHDGTIWHTGSQLKGINGDLTRTISTVSDGSSFPVLQTLVVDPQGRLWAGGMLGLYYREGNELVRVSGLDERHVQSLYFARDGTLWIGTETGLLVRRGDELIYRDQTHGMPSNSVHFITQTQDGVVWVGTKSGILRYDSLTLEPIGEPLLIGDFVRDIVEAADGSIWIGTYGGGLKRLKNGQTSVITRSNGLPNNFISRILVADDGKFWILSNFGIFAVTREELDRVANGESNLLGGAVFGVADGMTSSEANGGHQPAGTKAADGRLWFPMIDDLVWIDPKNLAENPPRVLIERATSSDAGIGGSAFSFGVDLAKGIDVSDGFRNLEIEYVALSFAKPEAVRFVYMLEGLDPDWIDAGSRRTAFYPYLPAGKYQFSVRAVNAGGVWSETPASIQIRVAERFWETRWFFTLILVAAFAIVALLLWNRIRRLNELQTRKAEFARRLINASEQERHRIASDLHDGLNQNLLLIKNWAREARKKVSLNDRSLLNDLNKIESSAAGSIDETRTIIQNLGPQNLTRFGLTEAIINMLEQVEDAFGVTFEKNVENIDSGFDQESQLSIYRIIQECVNNVIKHSESPRVNLLVKNELDHVLIAVEDFGIGFGPKESDGTGLINLQERAELLGGSVKIDSVPREGTVVTIRVPYRR